MSGQQRVAFLPEEIKRRVELYRTDPVLIALRAQLCTLHERACYSVTWDVVVKEFGPVTLKEPWKSQVEQLQDLLDDYINSTYGDIINIAEPEPEFKMSWLIPKGKGSADDLPPVNFFPDNVI